MASHAMVIGVPVAGHIQSALLGFMAKLDGAERLVRVGRHDVQ